MGARGRVMKGGALGAKKNCRFVSITLWKSMGHGDSEFTHGGFSISQTLKRP